MGVVCLVHPGADPRASGRPSSRWGTVAAAPPRLAAAAGRVPAALDGDRARRGPSSTGASPGTWRATRSTATRSGCRRASIWGVYGVGALVVGAVARCSRRASRAARLVPVLAAALLVLAAGSFGARAAARRRRPERPELSVALLQPNLTEEMRATPGAAAARPTARCSRRRARPPRRQPALIVIPESALPVVLGSAARRSGRTSPTLAQQGPRILFNDVEEEPDGRYYNVGAAARRAGPRGSAVPEGPPRAVRRVRAAAARLLLRAADLDGDRRVHARRAAPTVAPLGRARDRHRASATRSIYPSLARRGGGRRREPARDDLQRLLVRPRRARRSSTSRAPCCARSRTTATSSGRRSPASRASWTRADGSWPRRRPDERALVRGERPARDGPHRLDPVGLPDPGRRRRRWRPPCYSSASSAGVRRRRLAARGPRPTNTMTERDDLSPP